MRSFITTLILFAIMIAVIFLNGSYVRQTSLRLEEFVSDDFFEHDPERAIESLDEFWQKNSSLISISVGYRELDRISELIIDLKMYFRFGDTNSVIKTRALIADAANDLSRLEKFNLENLV